jgi:hypothetical protein
MIQTITPENATELRQRADAFTTWLGDRRSYRPEEVPEAVRITNEELSRLEQFETLTNHPDRLFVYIRDRTKQFGGAIEATTFMGDSLGFGTRGRGYQSNFGDTRVPIWIRIRGVDYVGTYYESAGDYARLRKERKRK